MERIVPWAADGVHSSSTPTTGNRRARHRVVSGMSEKLVLVPGPDHPITVAPSEQTVTVTFRDRVIAKTDDALVLRESTYPPRFYLPLDAVDAEVLRPTSHQTYCPYKGDASYYSLTDGDAVSENAVWTYLAPYDAVSGIAGRVAFYPHQVEITVG
jgi:uncharacterized protein (DUF427 family)